MTVFSIIASIDKDGVIGCGKTNSLLYDIPEDKKYFREITEMGSTKDCPNVLIMGKNTWLSIPSNHRPLKNRLNVIISSTMTKMQPYDNVIVYKSLHDFMTYFIETKLFKYNELFVIGGGEIYSQFMREQLIIKMIYLTVVDSNLNKAEKPIYFPTIDHSKFTLIRETKLMTKTSTNVNVNCNFKVYQNDKLEYRDIPFSIINKHLTFTKELKDKGNPEEMQYINAMGNILLKGDKRETRNSTTISEFGIRMEFDLSNGKLPVMTTKKMAIKTVIKELLWFISGSTNNRDLQDVGVHIWDGNSSREYLDSHGFHDREEGDLGPIYGFQWRRSGAPYKGCNYDYSKDKCNQGVDQLKECIREIIENPSSRRMLVCAWNPTDIKMMALPPCHVLFQWYVSSTGGLSLQLYQRSGDFFLGVPFNIMSYSLLVHMVASITGTRPDKFIHIIGDSHIYSDHIDAIKEQLTRVPNEFPTVNISKKSSIDDFKLDDFEIVGYECHDRIAAKMIP